jgi:hypothetical protein
MRKTLRREVRFLKLYAVANTLLIVFLLSTGFRQATPQKTKFEEIDVERINIVERDGRLRLVIANSERQTPPIIDNRVLSTARRPAGMIFFNEIGDEVGGLIFSGQQTNTGARASGSLTFDQFKQDQTIALQYAENNGQRRAGLEVIDRPATSLTMLVDLRAKRASATTEAERTEIDRQIAALGQQTSQRMFLGKDFEGRSTLVLSDGQGRPRLRLNVDAAGTPRILFLNADGSPAREIVP